MRATFWYSIFVTSSLLASSHVQARVITWKESGLAPYVRGFGQMSNLNQGAFENATGAQTTLNGKSTLAYGGELGLGITLFEDFSLRFAAEVAQNQAVNDKGLSAAGVERYTLKSEVFYFNPTLFAEYAFDTSESFRFFAFAGVGYATTTVENKFDMTTQGTTDLGVNDFSEKMEGTGLSWQVGTGMEIVFIDNVTLFLDVGYKMLKVTNLAYISPANTIVKTTGVAKGDRVTNSDGNGRVLDLGGFTGGLGLRFYLPF